MYKLPSRKRRVRTEVKKPNLVPILDAVFIFIFFLLLSANFSIIYEITSNVPIVSDSPPPKEKPLALTLRINRDDLSLYKGVPSIFVRKFTKRGKEYDLLSLRSYLISIKQKFPKEKGIIFEPKIDLKYEEIVKIMDAVRQLKNTEPAIYVKDKVNGDVRTRLLFDDIIFGDIQS